jgi:hypothetical protein
MHLHRLLYPNRQPPHLLQRLCQRQLQNQQWQPLQKKAFSAGSKDCSATQKCPSRHLLPAHRNPQLEQAKYAVTVVMAARKDAMAKEVSARSVAVNAVAVMAGVVAVAVAKVVQKVVLKGAPMDDLKAVNHVKTVEEKVVVASVANATRKARRDRSVQQATQHSAQKVVATLVNNVNHAKVAATAVNVVVVTVQSVAASAMVNALSVTRQSKTWHLRTRRPWLQQWEASRSNVQKHHKVSAANAVNVASEMSVAMAAVASAAMTALKAMTTQRSTTHHKR